MEELYNIEKGLKKRFYVARCAKAEKNEEVKKIKSMRVGIKCGKG
jgi:hypothetical protein